MQKKLLAVAVAGALGTPAVAMAQATTTATIYGTVSATLEWRSATGGDASVAPGNGTQSSLRTSGAALGTTSGTVVAATAATSQLAVGGGTFATAPADINTRTASQMAGSNFGIRVREDLGAGMYAWLQAELSMAATGTSQPGATTLNIGPTYRNTALALGSNAWGDVLWGMWDTPYNVNMNSAPQHAAYSNASTNFSSQLFGGGPWGASQTVSGVEVTAACAAASINTTVGVLATGTAALTLPATFANTAQSCVAQAMSFHRRQANTLQYWSPTWSGFQLKVMYGAEQLRSANNAAPQTTPQMWSGTLTYAAGPLYVGLGYESHKDFTAAAVQNYTATGGFGALMLGGNTTAGVVSSVAKWSGGATGISASNDRAYNFNARYTFGAFTLGGYYERIDWRNTYGVETAGDITSMTKKAYGLEGAFVTGPHTVGIRYAKAKSLEGTSLAGGNVFIGGATGANAYIFGYGYNLSKRTSLQLYHVRVNNDTNSRYQGIVFNGLSPAAGGQPRYTGFGLRHTF